MVKNKKSGYFKKVNLWYLCYCIGLRCENKSLGMEEFMSSYTLEKENLKEKRKEINVQKIAIDAVFIALTYVFTAFINIRLPIAGNGGLIHLGNIPLFIAAIVFGWKTGMIVGGIGMGLFDITSGFWLSWAPFTIVIVGLMGFLIGKITENKNSKFSYVAAIIVAIIVKVVGYYIAEGIIYGNFIAPIYSVPGNIIQVGLAGIIVLPVIGQLKNIANRILRKEQNYV